MNIGDLFMALKIDPSGDLKAAVTKAAEDAGDAGGVTLGKAISTALKGASLVIGAGLAVATKGAVEAEKAQGEFMKATGKSREEAKAFVSQMDALAGSAGTANHSFEEIAATGTMIEQQFGTSGEATRDLTEAVLEYSNVAGGEAVDNAAQLEDTLSSLNLTSDDAVGLMDKLVASSQKYGTDAGPAALAALQDMAPALEAMNMGVDDGIAFLNAFEVAGGKAEDATAALNKAVKTLKPGQDINDLIQQVSSIEDPMLRSQKATELFGKAAGPGMFKLIQPGMQSLDDFKVSAQEAGGSVHKAADDMLTFTDRIKGWADKALAGARELGQQFGPALSGVGAIAGALGPTLIDGVKKAWGMVKNSDAVQGAAEGALDIAGTATGAAGTIIGNLTGNLIQAVTTSWDKVKAYLLQPGSATQRAIAAAGAASGAVYGTAAAVVETIASGIAKMWVAVGSPGSSVVNAAAAAGSAAGLSWSGAVVLAIGTLGLAAIGKVMGDALSGNGGADKPGGANVGDIWLQRFKTGALNGAPTVGTEIGTAIAEPVTPAMIDALNADSEARENYIHTGLLNEQALINAGLSGGQAVGEAGGKTVVPAWIAAQEAAASANKDSLSLWSIVEQQQIARTAHAKEVFANSARAVTGSLADELRGGAKTVVKDAMDDLLWAMNHPMALNKRTAEIEAALNGQAMADGLASKNPAIRTVAEQTRFTLIQEWEKINGKPYGQDAGADFKTALGDQLRAAVAAARNAVDDINAALRSIKSNVRINVDARGDFVGHGGNPGIPGRASGGSALAGHLYRVNETRKEYFRPAVNGRVLALGDNDTTAASGLTLNGDINITVPDGEPHTIKNAVMDALAEVGRMRLNMSIDASGTPA